MPSSFSFFLPVKVGHVVLSIRRGADRVIKNVASWHTSLALDDQAAKPAILPAFKNLAQLGIDLERVFLGTPQKIG